MDRQDLTTTIMMEKLRRRVSLTSERGAIEYAILVPIFLIMIFGIVQAGIYLHARNMSLAAAQDGLAAARIEGGALDEGRERAVSVLDAAGGDEWMRNIDVHATAEGDQIRVTVTGTSFSIIPGFPEFEIHQTAAGPRERWTTP